MKRIPKITGTRISMLDMLERLVAFDTTSSRSNLELVKFVEDYLAGWGVRARLSHSDDGHKANILATIGPDAPAGVVLSGHTDVVPITGQTWSTPPFRLTAKKDRVYGRGTADMKSFIAVALSLVPDFLAANLRQPIHLALSYDEEVGCFGAPRLLDELATYAPQARAVIVGEPSGMRIVNAHKGVRIYRTTVTGVETHSSMPEAGVNAVTHGAALICLLADIEEELKQQIEAPHGESNGFSPPYGTLNVGHVAGGISQNVVPRDCSFEWETRLLPWQDPDAIERRFGDYVDGVVLPRMKTRFASAMIETERVCDVPGLRPETGSQAESLCVHLLGNNTVYNVPFGSEAGLFQREGLSTVICGPGEIAQAHRPDEYIEIDQINACEKFMRRLAAHLAGTAI